MLNRDHYARLGLAEVFDAVLAGQRISVADGEKLFACEDIHAVGALAHHARTRLHGNRTHYVLNRHVNYTNICVNECRFCAYHRRPNQAGGYLLSPGEVVALLSEPQALAATEVHIVGGCHPDLRLDYYETLLHAVKAARPDALIKAFTAVEIGHFAAVEGVSTREVLLRLKDAGLAMLPGGGAEIFDPEVRTAICPNKISGAEWLRIAGEAHTLGIKSNCTMLYGHMETPRHRLEHLDGLRRQQDATGGFVCCIPLPFLTENNPLGKLSSRGVQSGLDDLRTMAVTRLMLDNVPHLKAYWVMHGVKLAQAMLHFGADDLDGTVVEEKIGHTAGAESAQALTSAELEAMIRASGFTPVRRDALFRAQEEAGGNANGEAADAPQAPAGPAAPSAQVAPTGGPTLVGGTALLRERSPFDEPAAVRAIADKILDGVRIDASEAATLYSEAGLFTLGALAHAVRLRLHPEPVVTFVGDRNINYSNVCVCGCRFCAFFRAPGRPGGYVLTREELAQKIEETLALGGTQILMQGGHHPDLPLEWYEDTLRFIKTYPIHVHAFSPPEIVHFSKLFGLPTAEVIRRLRAAGLDSIPGGGAEILVDAVRSRVSPNKCPADEWLDVMRQAHLQGMRTTATMMFGHEETPAQRIEHLLRIRELQDETGGFTAFIPWAFQPEHTAIPGHAQPAAAYLRLLALARLVLDNVANLQASWVTMGPKVAQLALFFGANDFGSTMIEENVVAAAGVSFRLSAEQIRRIVRAAAFTPRQRSMDYTLLPETAAED
jgi:dehypoxanthine futalosine cyclase/putative menaquinone biosynthesis radical SAM enzyme